MTRHTRFVIITAVIIALWGLSVGNPGQASEHQWTSLDGPYWANGIDVAYGMSGLGQDWHRYVIGSDGDDIRPFWSDETFPNWHPWSQPLAANRLISYKNAGSGHYAVCSAYDDDVYLTENGGSDWTNLIFPETFNRHFSSVEILNQEQNPGNSVFVGCESSGSLATTYYTTDAGSNWARLGGDQGVDPIYGLHIYDVESVQSSFLTAGTSDGLYRHEVGNFGSVWQYVAFQGLDVKAIETVDLQDDEQLAAVFDGQDWSLQYTDDGWTNHQEVLIGGLPVNKEVHDIAGIGWGDPAEPKSFYLATADGLFLLVFHGNLQDVYMYDLGNDAQFGYKPLIYDNNISSVDYYFYEEGNEKHANVLVSTPYNVYEVHETRQIGAILDIFSVEFSEIVTGTYRRDMVGGE